MAVLMKRLAERQVVDARSVGGFTAEDIAAMEAQIELLTTLLQGISRETLGGHDTFVFTGMNVQIQSGSGNTHTPVNGVGNLIVGYNRDTGNPNQRTGSHNLIVGDEHEYTSSGGVVFGSSNTITAVSASVTGGTANTASGPDSSVSGGIFGTAIGVDASISGGWNNSAVANYSSVVGGRFNIATGSYSTVSGGEANIAFGFSSSVTGGDTNTAADFDTAVGGDLVFCNVVDSGFCGEGVVSAVD